MQDRIIIGPGDDYELTLAHELGHLMGGHFGGEHRDDKENLMFKTAIKTPHKRIDLLQMLYFKSSPFAEEDKKIG